MLKTRFPLWASLTDDGRVVMLKEVLTFGLSDSVTLRWHLHFCVKLSVVVVVAVRIQEDEALLHVRQVVAHNLDIFDGGDRHVHLIAAIDVLQVGQFDDRLGEREAEHVVLEGQVLDVLESERLGRGVVDTVVQKFNLFGASLLDPVKIDRAGYMWGRGEMVSLIIQFGKR